ncbi:hypothetical protein [Pseudoalteromonas arctica]|uniref:Uncharacterized protein n=1 Tax=Pseudoalteromonas arctica A 37-1-2 TaxID=1117313 RepID=A0A290SAB6_9GAMM|nr:hypothetical protein [Pseudoalteromonas arctica]ATC88635.1 hypothetical protein PARC_b0435 [Pseudoalteromonas arctica A 37-1-2]
MEEIYPVEELQEKFEAEVSVEYYFMKDIDTIAKLEPSCLCEIGGNAWMHYVESGAKVNPRKLSEHFDNGNPFLFREVEKVMKKKVLQDIVLVHAKVQDPELENKICGQFLLARVYPNNLHISDVEFSNPYEPVPENEKKHHFHEYRSLGLFAKLLKNIIVYGKKNSIAKITLSAASDHQIKYFESHGFNIENNNFSKDALEHGMSIPMERKCI